MRTFDINGINEDFDTIASVKAWTKFGAIRKFNKIYGKHEIVSIKRI